MKLSAPLGQPLLAITTTVRESVKLMTFSARSSTDRRIRASKAAVAVTVGDMGATETETEIAEVGRAEAT